MTMGLNIVCPSCGAVNRAPQARLAAGARPVCGRCKDEIFKGKPTDIETAEAFDRMIDRNDIPVVVDFWADWCGPCKMMAPHFATATRDMEPQMRFAKLDTEALPDVAARFNIRGIPTMILFHGGREVARQSGAMDAASIEHWIAGKLTG